MSQILKTQCGEIELLDITDELLKELQERLTYGFMPFGKDFNGARYGFVVRCGENEIPCLKQQMVEQSQEMAMKILNLHSQMIVDVYSKLADRNLDCVYYATPYIKDKGEGKFETGIAHFIFPGEIADPKIKVSEGLEIAPYDNCMGAGATRLATEFINEFNSRFNDRFRLQYIGLDVRTRSKIGSMLSSFMLCRDMIIYHGAKVSEDDPRFAILARNGIRKVYFAPSLPMTISDDQLKAAKGD